MIQRRTFLATTGAAIFTAPLVGEAQSSGNLPRVGVLSSGFASHSAIGGQFAYVYLAIREGLRENGYVDGQNLTIEYRFAEGRIDRLVGLAGELVSLNVNVILALGVVVLRAVKNVTATVPIVVIDLETDPVSAGFAASLARPGGNITGTFLDQPELAGKWLELLKEAVPKLSRAAVLWDSTTASDQLNAIVVASKALAVKLQTLEVRDLNEFERAFAAATKGGAQAIVILSSPLVVRNGARLADLAARRRLSTIALFSELATAGCLMSYGPSLADMYRHLGYISGSVLKGARPGDTPIQRPTKFELVINLKTAKALGLTIPQSLLLRADHVIQ